MLKVDIHVDSIPNSQVLFDKVELFTLDKHLIGFLRGAHYVHVELKQLGVIDLS